MTDPNTITEPHSLESPERAALQPHVREFLELSEALDQEIKKDDDIAIKQIETKLRVFYGTLEAEKQQDIMHFLQQQNAAIRIENERGTISKAIHQTMDWTERAVHETGAVVAIASAGIVHLGLSFVGGVAGGVRSGAKAIKRSWLNAA